MLSKGWWEEVEERGSWVVCIGEFLVREYMFGRRCRFCFGRGTFIFRG